MQVMCGKTEIVYERSKEMNFKFSYVVSESAGLLP